MFCIFCQNETFYKQMIYLILKIKFLTQSIGGLSVVFIKNIFSTIARIEAQY